jgi:hypothetical protein
MMETSVRRAYKELPVIVSWRGLVTKSVERSKYMKSVVLIVRQTEIGKLFPNGFRLLLEDNACVLNAINAVDEEIKKACEKFPVKGFGSLLQMVYHPNENRFYKQVAVQAFSESQPFVNIRGNPKTPLPNDVTIVLVPQGGCTTDWEEPIK